MKPTYTLVKNFKYKTKCSLVGPRQMAHRVQIFCPLLVCTSRVSPLGGSTYVMLVLLISESMYLAIRQYVTHGHI